MKRGQGRTNGVGHRGTRSCKERVKGGTLLASRGDSEELREEEHVDAEEGRVGATASGADA